MKNRNKFGNSSSCDWIPFIFLFFIIILIILGGCGTAYGPQISTFANEYYNEWEDQLDALKTRFEIGKPNGVLSYLPEQTSCKTNSNLLVQGNVAFKPNRHETGCTYVDSRYPG